MHISASNGSSLSHRTTEVRHGNIFYKRARAPQNKVPQDKHSWENALLKENAYTPRPTDTTGNTAEHKYLEDLHLEAGA